MTIKKQHFIIFTLLFCAALSVHSVAQERYTVDRPVTTPFKETSPEFIPRHTATIHWETNYEDAIRTAKTSSQRLLIYLYANGNTELPEALIPLPVVSVCKEFDTVILDDDVVRTGLSAYLLLKLPIDAKVPGEDGVEMPIYSLPGFEHMLGHPGLVVIDFSSRDMPYYGEVVGILPFLRGGQECPSANHVDTFLSLPPGTLTQRTLTYAVRIHPDKPLSSEGEPIPVVMQTATDHALFQAERGVIGHHNFSTRSSKVREVLGDGSPSEICAQCRSGENLFEGAIACMRLWRTSSAHWSIARKSHTYYGYDMARSDRNGCWYGVGFFIDVPKE